MNHLDESAKWVFENQFLPLLDVIHRINSLKMPSTLFTKTAVSLQFWKKRGQRIYEVNLNIHFGCFDLC